MASRYRPRASRGDLAATDSTTSTPSGRSWSGAPSSAPRSMARIAFWIAKRRTSRSTAVNAPWLNTGSPARFVRAIDTTTPVESSALENLSKMSWRAAADDPTGTRSSSWKPIPQTPRSPSW